VCLTTEVAISTRTGAGLVAPSGAGELLQLMLDGTPRTRAELIRITGLARSTVGARVDALLAVGLLVPSGEAASTGGRPPAQLAFNPDAGVIIGIDIGATHALVALTDLRGRVIDEEAVTIDVQSGPAPVLDRVVEVASGLLQGGGRSRADVLGVGVGLPGPVEHSTGRPVLPPIMPGWDGYDVPSHVSASLGGPVLVDNDVNLMALGEHATVYPHVEQLLFVKVATGIGAGIISGGRLHRGAQGAAGDLGHVAAQNGGDTPCTCGNLGCLEAVASGPAITRGLRARGIAVQDSADLVRLAKTGDLEAVAALREAGREIGRVLATCVSLLNPSIISVGGILAQASEQLLAGIREVVYGRSLPLATGDLQIVASRTAGHAGVVGAATMVIQQVLSVDEVESQVAALAG
jgi:predicted NBD/HSP70 family sugar kinase